MRRVLFWLILLIALFLVIVLGVAAKRKITPRAVLQDWFGNTAIVNDNNNTGDTNNNPTTGDNTNNSSDLSDEEKADTQLFLDSLIETQ